MNIVEKEIAQLRPYEKNAKTHPKKQVDLLAKNIERFGFTTPVLIDENGNVIAGHGRLLAMKKLGKATVPCVLMEGLTENEVKALRLADNKIAELGEWDMGLALAELGDLDEEMRELTGFDLDLLIDENEKDDVVPETPKVAKSKRGDLYELGNHRVLCGDSADAGDAERLMDGNAADMIFTDPPYNVNYKGQGKNTSNTILSDNVMDDEFDKFLEKVFENCSKHARGGAGAYVFHASRTQTQFERAMNRSGYRVKNQLIWNKPMAALGWGDYQWKHEPFFYAGKEKTKFYGDRTNKTVWDFQQTDQQLANWAKRQKKLEAEGKTTVWTMRRDKVGEYVHPTQKPVELIQHAIRNSSRRGDIVMDLFLGSGSTLIASEKMGRACYGMELDPRYVDVIVSRYVEFTGKKTIKKNGKEIVWKK